MQTITLPITNHINQTQFDTKALSIHDNIYSSPPCIQKIHNLINRLMKDCEINLNDENSNNANTKTSDNALFLKSKKKTKISLLSYLERLISLCEIELNTAIIMGIYFERGVNIVKSCGVSLHEISIYRLILISMIVSVKYSVDEHYDNDFYSKAGGISLEELNQIEVSFLNFLDFDLNVDIYQFNQMEMKYNSIVIDDKIYSKLD